LAQTFAIGLPLILAGLLACFGLAGCVVLRVSPFPALPQAGQAEDGVAARRIFDRCLAEHGGDLRRHPGDLNLSTDGHWFALIQRIQPVVTDSAFRIRSEDRYRPGEGLYVVRHFGPSGVKQVVRRGGRIESVRYNGALEQDPTKLSATAMTNDAFLMFHFGPTFFLERVRSWSLLPEASEEGRSYHRIIGTLTPGFGDAADDRVVLWVDADSFRLFRIHMTLNGFETTKGAHVDTTFLAYREAAGYLLPVRFHERVRGPLHIDAHTWWTTGLDLDRGWNATDVAGEAFTGRAAAAARPLLPPEATARTP
jgi:hypothetical protein